MMKDAKTYAQAACGSKSAKFWTEYKPTLKEDTRVHSQFVWTDSPKQKGFLVPLRGARLWHFV